MKRINRVSKEYQGYIQAYKIKNMRIIFGSLAIIKPGSEVLASPL